MTISVAARLYSDLCLDVYYSPGNSHRPIFSSGAERQGAWETDFRSKFAAAGNAELLGVAAYQTGSQTVVAFDGWEDGGLIWNQIVEKANAIGLGLGFETAYLNFGIAFAYYVAAGSGKTPQELFFTGHSQGGGVAASVAAYFGADAFIFNPATTSSATTALVTGDRVIVSIAGGGEVFSLPINYVENPGTNLETLRAQHQQLAEELAELLYPTATLSTSIVAANHSSSTQIDGLRVANDLAGNLSFGDALGSVLT